MMTNYSFSQPSTWHSLCTLKKQSRVKKEIKKDLFLCKFFLSNFLCQWLSAKTIFVKSKNLKQLILWMGSNPKNLATCHHPVNFEILAFNTIYIIILEMFKAVSALTGSCWVNKTKSNLKKNLNENSLLFIRVISTHVFLGSFTFWTSENIFFFLTTVKNDSVYH